MKKIIFFVLVVLIGFGGAYLYNALKGPTTVNTTFRNENKVTATPTREEAEKPSTPTTIEIPKLNVTADIEQVGKDSQGRMDVPKNFLNTGWYMLGPVPGTIGNSVIAGHFDTPTGAPSVFYYLGSLSKGDEIIITDENGKKRIFKVYDVENFEDASFPIQKVFGDSNNKNLNLITCAGTYDRSARNYSERTVVFSRLEDQTQT